MKQKPACILDIRVPPGSFDVNLTPDKREIVLTHESLLLDKLREELDALYLPSRQTFHLAHGVGGGTQQDLFNYSFGAASSSSASSSSASSSAASSSAAAASSSSSDTLSTTVRDTTTDDTTDKEENSGTTSSPDHNTT